MTNELEPIEPAEALDWYLEHREDDLSQKTIKNYRYRIQYFVRWCDKEGIDNLNTITGRDLNQYKLWRKRDAGLKPITLKSQLNALRGFIRFCESIDAIEPETHTKILCPKISKHEDERDTFLDADEAHALLSFLHKFHYASKRHAMFLLVWHTGIRLGSLRTLDIGDYDPNEQYIDIHHRPESGTPLKNKEDGEREVHLAGDVCEVLDDYIATHRDEVEDEHGRQPLFTTRNGRPHENQIRRDFYSMTRPCWYEEGCPHGRDPDECEARYRRKASKCPSSVSTHPVRRGSITYYLNDGASKEAVSERMNVSPGVLEKHYDQRTKAEKRENRKGFFEQV